MGEGYVTPQDPFNLSAKKSAKNCQRRKVYVACGGKAKHMFGSGCGVECSFREPLELEGSGNFSTTEKGLEHVRCGVVPRFIAWGPTAPWEGFH